MIGHESWTAVKLGDVCSSITVGHVGSMASEYVETGVPFLRSQNVAPFRIASDNLKYISPEFHSKLAKCALSPGDVVVVRTGYPGTAAVIPSWLKEANCADLVVIRPGEDVDPRYIVAIFNSAWGIAHVGRSTVGVAQQHFNIGTARKLEVRLPPLPTQRRIASILSAYDDLIENNTKRIEILEEMARSLYREWFVHFRFPGHEKVKLVDSELGKIPEGWEVLPLQRLQADTPNAINGGPFGSKLGRKDYVDEGVPVIRGTNLTTTGRYKDYGYVYVTPENAETLRSNMARPGDIVVTQRGTLGQVARIPENSDHSEFVISQSQMKVTFHKDKLDNDYGFYSLKSTEAVERLKNLASSSGVPHINLVTLREFPIRVPPLDQQRAFGAIVGKIEALVENLTRRNTVLRQTRDLLLPKLISGEIDVDALDLPEAS